MSEENNMNTVNPNGVQEDNGINISNDVVAVIAGMAASNVQGVADMAGGFASGVSEALSGKKNMAKGIKVDINGNQVKIDVHILVEYGARIPDVAFEIQKNVKQNVESMTGLNANEVNVHVQGVSINNSQNVNSKAIEAPKEDKTDNKKNSNVQKKK